MSKIENSSRYDDDNDLYSFPSKPFIHTISSDEDDGIISDTSDIFTSDLLKGSKKRNKKPTKYKQQKKVKPIVLDDSSEDEIKPITIDSDEEGDTIEAKAKQKAESIIQQTMNSIKPSNSNSVVMNLVMSSESEIQKLSSLLSKLKQTRSASLIEDITDDIVEPSAHYPPPLPVVRRASERIAPSKPLMDLPTVTPPSPAKPVPTITNPIKLNTRLNGKHKGNWKMSKSDNFLKV